MLGLSLIFSTLFVTVCVQGMDSTFERVESIDGTGEIIMSWAVRRTGRNAYSLSGNLTINPPFTLHPEKYYQSTEFFVSSSGSSDFRLLPVHFKNGSFCEYLNMDYRKYFMEHLKYPVSNFPYSNNIDEDFCDLIRSNESHHFWVKDFKLDASHWPSYTPTGLIKMVGRTELAGQIIGGLTIFVRIDDVQ